MAMKKSAHVILLAGVTLLLVIVANLVVASNNRVQPTATSSSVVTQERKSANRDDLLALVNAERLEQGARPLVIDATLDASAQRKADELQTEGVLNNNPHVNSRGIQGFTYAYDLGVQCVTVSENIVWSRLRANITSEEAFAAWVDSEAHYATMIDQKYDTTGFGFAGANVVQHFCDKS